jgi:hypothetical protein
MNRAFLFLAVGAIGAISGCSFGQVQSIDVSGFGGVVQGQVTSDQDWSSGAVNIAAVAAPAPKIPRAQDFNTTTDTASVACATVTDTAVSLVKDVTIPIGSEAAVDPACAPNQVGRKDLQPGTEYNVRLCASDSTHTTGFSCGGVKSFTTDDP